MPTNPYKNTQGLFATLPDDVILTIYENFPESILESMIQCSRYDRIYALRALLKRNTKAAINLKINLFTSWVVDPQSFELIKSQLKEYGELKKWINLLKKSYRDQTATVLYRALCAELMIMLGAEAKETMIVSRRAIIQLLDKQLGLHQFYRLNEFDDQIRIQILILMRHLPQQRIDECIASWQANMRLKSHYNIYFEAVYILGGQLSCQQMLAKEVSVCYHHHEIDQYRKFKGKSKLFSLAIVNKINKSNAKDLHTILKYLVTSVNFPEFADRYIFLSVIDGLNNDVISPYLTYVVKALCSILGSKLWELKIYAARILIEKSGWLSEGQYQPVMSQILELIKSYSFHIVARCGDISSEEMREIDKYNHISVIIRGISVAQFCEFVSFYISMQSHGLSSYEEALIIDISDRFSDLLTDQVKKIIDIVCNLLDRINSHHIFKSILVNVIKNIIRNSDDECVSHLIDQLINILVDREKNEVVKDIIRSILIENKHRIQSYQKEKLCSDAFRLDNLESLKVDEVAINNIGLLDFVPENHHILLIIQQIHIRYNGIRNEEKYNQQLCISSICEVFETILPYLDNECIEFFRSRVLSYNHLYSFNSIVAMMSIINKIIKYYSPKEIERFIDLIVYNIKHIYKSVYTAVTATNYNIEKLESSILVFCKNLSSNGFSAEVNYFFYKLSALCEQNIIPFYKYIIYVLPFISDNQSRLIYDDMYISFFKNLSINLTEVKYITFQDAFFDFICDNYKEFKVLFVCRYFEKYLEEVTPGIWDRSSMRVCSVVSSDSNYMSNKIMYLLGYYIDFFENDSVRVEIIKTLSKFPQSLLSKIHNDQLLSVVNVFFKLKENEHIKDATKSFIMFLTKAYLSINDDTIIKLFKKILEYLDSTNSYLVDMAFEICRIMSESFSQLQLDTLINVILSKRILANSIQRWQASIVIYKNLSVEARRRYIANITSSQECKTAFINIINSVIDDVFDWFREDEYQELLEVIIDIHNELWRKNQRVKLTLALHQLSTYAVFTELEELRQSVEVNTEKERGCSIL